MIIDRTNLSQAWAAAFLACMQGSRALRPLVVTIGDFQPPAPPEDFAVRDALNDMLASLGKVSIDVSAMMIFPYKPWVRRGKPGCPEFSKFCVSRLLPRLRKLDRRNQNGTYFERMMAFTGMRRSGIREVNQLQFVLDLFQHHERRPRQSALQIAIFDPAKDHTGQPVRGFPCLQQVSVAYDDDGNLAVNAYYPTQYIFDRAYGNYLGLCHLGEFLARETNLRFVRLTCFIGRPALGEVSQRDVDALVPIAERALQALNGNNNAVKGRSG